MRFMPDSAILGTIGHAKRRAAKGRRGGAVTLSEGIPALRGVISLAWVAAWVGLIAYFLFVA